jgi:hypothetical protein
MTFEELQIELRNLIGETVAFGRGGTGPALIGHQA